MRWKRIALIGFSVCCSFYVDVKSYSLPNFDVKYIYAVHDEFKFRSKITTGTLESSIKLKEEKKILIEAKK